MFLRQLARVMVGKIDAGLFALHRLALETQPAAECSLTEAAVWLLIVTTSAFAMTLTNDGDLSGEVLLRANAWLHRARGESKGSEPLLEILSGELSFVEALVAIVISDNKAAEKLDIAKLYLRVASETSSKVTSRLSSLELAKLYFNEGLLAECIASIESSGLLTDQTTLDCVSIISLPAEASCLQALHNEAVSLYADACAKRYFLLISGQSEFLETLMVEKSGLRHRLDLKGEQNLKLIA